MMKPPGTLYIVATPIGNPGDITQRALEVLASVDAIICEELRPATTLLKRLEITPRKLLTLNEHNEAERVDEIVNRLAMGESFALISDCGTPVFADPGHALVRRTAELEFRVQPIPGVSSLMTALSLLDFKLERFVFGGFLARQPDQRRQELQRLRGLRMPIVLMDTPYRLGALLEEVSRAFGANHSILLAMDLTLPSEMILRGPIAEVRQQVGARKAEFILIVYAPAER